MASRRKQFKPKSFGTDEEIAAANVENKIIQQAEIQINQNQIDGNISNEKKRKRDEQVEEEDDNRIEKRLAISEISVDNRQDVSGSTAETINSGGETSSLVDDELDDDLDGEYDDDEDDEYPGGMSGNGYDDDEYHSYYDAANIDSSVVANGGLLLMFKCKVCGKAFKHRRSLSRHIKLHSGEKNFKCPYCTTAFARSDHLKAHIRTHNNTKPYRCSICHCGYSTQAALKVHNAHHHTKSKFHCSLCDLEFHSQLALEGHIYTKHGTNDSVCMKDLIDETNTLNPELVTADEAAVAKTANESPTLAGRQNIMSQINSNTLNNSSSMTQQRNPTIPASASKSTLALPIRPSGINDENMNESSIQNLTNRANEEEDDDDVIIESEISGSNLVTDQSKFTTNQVNRKPLPLLRPIMPNTQPKPSQITPVVAPSRLHFCSSCNMRFNTSEAYTSHMRSSHPNANSQPSSERTKMPFLTSILTSGPPSNLASVILKPGPMPMPTPTPTPVAMTPVRPATNPVSSVCNVASCNCSMKHPPQSASCSGRTLLANTLNTSNEYVYDEYHVVRETCYTCVQCQLTMHKLTDYMHHLKQEHCVEVYRCILCKQMQLFDNLNLLKDHFFTHHQSHKYDVFKCKLCMEQGGPNSSHKGFVFVEDLYSHLRQVHNQMIDLHRLKQKYSTPGDQTNNSSSYMNGVIAQYPPASLPLPPAPPPARLLAPKVFKCSHCDSDFSQFSSLSHHIQTMHQAASTVPAASQISTNNNQQPFACQYCRSTFTQRAQLERHMRIHLASTDLKCNICDLVFQTSSQLNEHKQQVHNKIPANQPTITNNPTTQNASTSPLTSTATTTAICVYCKQTLHNEQQFRDHFKRHNNIGQPLPPGTRPNSFMCIVCRQKLTSNNEYSIHLRNHLKLLPRPLPPRPSLSNEQVSKEPPPKTQIQPIASHNNENKQECVNFLLRCSKCPVKFEYGHEFVEHMKQAHPEVESKVECLGQGQKPSNNDDTVSKVARQPPNTKPAPPVVINPIYLKNALTKEEHRPISQPISFACEICSTNMDSSLRLNVHIILNHEFAASPNGLACPVCDEPFPRAEALLAHVSQHGQAARIYKCNHCPSSFVFKSQLINHSFSHNAQRNQSMDSIQKPVNQTTLINSLHQNGVTSRMASSNPQSGTNGFKTNGQEEHINHYIVNDHPVDGTKTYTCLTCSKTFSSQRNLNVHLRIHTGFRPFECNVCKRTFTRRENLRSHMKCHLNVRPFSCSICNRSFRRRSHVVSHLEVHFKSKLHTCIECARQFDQIDSFLAHIIGEHDIYDRELLQHIKTKNMLDLSQFNIDYARLNTQYNSAGLLNGQMLISQSNNQSENDSNTNGAPSDNNEDDEEYMNDEEDETYEEEGVENYEADQYEPYESQSYTDQYFDQELDNLNAQDSENQELSFID